MIPTKHLKVELGDNSYAIYVGQNLIGSAGNYIAPILPVPRAIIVTDENVAQHYLEPLQETLRKRGVSCDEIVLDAGEKMKSFEHLETLTNTLVSKNVERSTTLIALGGGVIGDLTGFAAAIFLRGINVIQIPTTLLAQVDSSVGGKTAINTPYGKNLVGAFHQPRLVLADIDTLDTLPKREISSGYAEITKYGLIKDKNFFTWLEENGLELCKGNKDYRAKAILESCQTKTRIVSMDERETGTRALLNLGHTFGHALEVVTGFSENLLHGEAVALGILLAYELSCRLGFCNSDEVRRIRAHYKLVGLPTNPLEVCGINSNIEALIEIMKKDKKVVKGQMRLILPKGIGSAFIADDIREKDVREIWTNALKLRKKINKN